MCFSFLPIFIELSFDMWFVVVFDFYIFIVTYLLILVVIHLVVFDFQQNNHIFCEESYFCPFLVIILTFMYFSYFMALARTSQTVDNRSDSRDSCPYLELMIMLWVLPYCFIRNGYWILSSIFSVEMLHNFSSLIH